MKLPRTTAGARAIAARPPHRRSPAPLASILALLCASSCAPPAAAPRVDPPRAPLVVTIVVDQLAAWILADRAHLLPASGGFARLRREGTWVVEAEHGHACTDTAPGHAALYTGATPRDSGIGLNERIDPKTRKAVPFVRDETTRLIGPRGPVAAPGASLAHLRVPTLADELLAARPNAVVVSLSLKDRGALFGGGRSPRAVLWFDKDLDAFVTSSAFAQALPTWAGVANGDSGRARLRPSAWTPADTGFLAAHAKTLDDDEAEGDLAGMGRVFPHPIARAASPATAFRASPQGDAALVDLALAAAHAERRSGEPMLLAISFSSFDIVGHVFGPDSHEAWDELYRLDASLARLFDGLDEEVSREGWSAVLSADHGVMPMPETHARPGARPWCRGAAADRFERPCGPGVRVPIDVLGEQLDHLATSVMGRPGPWVLGVSDPYVVLSDAARALDPTTRKRLWDALLARIAKEPGIARAIDVTTLPAECPPLSDASMDALVCRAYAPGASGDLYLVPTRGSMFDNGYVTDKGANHGTPYRHDRAVPILARAPGRIPSGVVLEAPMPAITFLRTAASLLGVAPPRAAREAPNLADRSASLPRR